MSTLRDFAMSALTLFLLGWVSVIVVTGCNVALQLAAPDALRGRIMSLHTFIYGGVFPFGAFSVGSISEHWGVPTAFRAAGIFGLVGLAAVLAWWRLRASEA
jgi:predicted MFS family arabinose efflux permease